MCADASVPQPLHLLAHMVALVIKQYHEACTVIRFLMSAALAAVVSTAALAPAGKRAIHRRPVFGRASGDCAKRLRGRVTVLRASLGA